MIYCELATDMEMKFTDICLVIIGLERCPHCTLFKTYHYQALKDYIHTRYQGMELVYIETSIGGMSTPTERDILIKLDQARPKGMRTRIAYPSAVLVSSNYRDMNSEGDIICQYIDYSMIVEGIMQKSMKINDTAIMMALDMYMDAEIRNFARSYLNITGSRQDVCVQLMSFILLTHEKWPPYLQ